VSGPGGATVWFQWTGVQELIAQFATLAPDLTTTSAPIVELSARVAKDTIYTGYPTRTGNLKKGLAVVVKTEATRTQATVVNKAPHAWLYERGSETRHSATHDNLGRMPPNPLFSSTMMRTRRALYTALVPHLVDQFGLTVTGVA
jgi:hypothetical protein